MTRVLVTGGAGFIGTHIVDLLLENGVRVSVLDDLSTGALANLDPRVNLYMGRIQDRELVQEAVGRERPDYVIHQAAQADVQVSLRDPGADAGVNILGAINLLEACRAGGVRKVVYASSAAVYGNPRYLPVDEQHPVAPVSGYGISKYTAERYLMLYSFLHGLEFTALRYANVYGPRQDASGEGGVVAIFCSRLSGGAQPVIYGDGKQTRDFIYVRDVAAANLAALQRGSGQILNISTGIPTSVNELLSALGKVAGSGLQAEYRAERPGDIGHSYLSPLRAIEALNWKPLVPLEEGLKITYAYFSRQSSVVSRR